jgi:hypothetical protein
MTVENWIKQPAVYARATRRVYDVDGSYAKRGEVGAICDYLPGETSAGGYVVVDFPTTGPVLCWPNEIRPA